MPFAIKSVALRVVMLDQLVLSPPPAAKNMLDLVFSPCVASILNFQLLFARKSFITMSDMSDILKFLVASVPPEESVPNNMSDPSGF